MRFSILEAARVIGLAASLACIGLPAFAKQYTLYVWPFSAQDEETRRLADHLTRELEEGLVNAGCVTVLERQEISRILAHRENESEITDIAEVNHKDKELLTLNKADSVVFGEVIDDIDGGEIKVTAKLQTFSSETVASQSIRFLRGKKLDPEQRERSMANLAAQLCAAITKPVPNQAPVESGELDQEDLNPEVITRIILEGDWPEKRNLTKRYKEGTEKTRKDIIETILRLTQSAELKNISASVRFLATESWFFNVLHHEDGMQVAARLASLSEMDSEDIRSAVVSVFWLGVDDEDLVPLVFGFMSRLAKDPNREVRKEALSNLGNLADEAHPGISDEVWRILYSAWKNETTDVRAAALAGFQDFRHDEDEGRRQQLSKIIIDALRSKEGAINNSALWVLGGLGGGFTPPDPYNKDILKALLKLYRIDRSSPRSWYIDAFENLRGELPAWAEDKLEGDKKAEKDWREEAQRLRERIEQEEKERKNPPR